MAWIRRNLALLAGGLAAALFLAALTVAAVVVSIHFVIDYAREGPLLGASAPPDGGMGNVGHLMESGGEEAKSP